MAGDSAKYDYVRNIQHGSTDKQPSGVLP